MTLRSSRAQLKRVAVLSTAVLLSQGFLSSLWEGFEAFAIAGPATLDPPVPDVIREVEAAIERMEEEERKKRRDEEDPDKLKARNYTLELSTGEPDWTVPGVINGSPYTTCFVEYEDRSQRDMEGTVQARNVLEEWVMRGQPEIVDGFRSWRLHRDATANIRCMQSPSASVEGTMCLECISQASSVMPGAVVGTLHPSRVMTFSGLQSCLATASKGFCKSGLVSIPL